MPQEGRKIGFRGEANPPEKKPNAPQRRTRIGFDTARTGQEISFKGEQEKSSGGLTQEEKNEIKLLINALTRKVLQKHREVLAEIEKLHRAGDRGADSDWMLLAENALAAFQGNVDQAVERFDSEEIPSEKISKETFERDLRNFAAEAKQSYGFILYLMQKRR